MIFRLQPDSRGQAQTAIEISRSCTSRMSLVHFSIQSYPHRTTSVRYTHPNVRLSRKHPSADVRPVAYMSCTPLLDVRTRSAGLFALTPPFNTRYPQHGEGHHITRAVNTEIVNRNDSTGRSMSAPIPYPWCRQDFRFRREGRKNLTNTAVLVIGMGKRL